MKKLITNYTFDASAKTVTLTGLTGTLLEQVLLITNVTDSVIIYNFADSNKGGSISSGVITLTFDTTTMSDNDDLQIFIDDLTEQQTDALTDTELRATAVPVSVSGVATSAKQDTIIGHVDGIESLLSDIDSGKLEETTFTGRIGEVQANPTANTLLARLKTIADNQLPNSHDVTIDNASIAVTNAGITTIAGAVSGNEMQVDVLTLPNVTIGSSLPAGTNGIGKLTANSGVDIGDVDVLSLPAIPAGTNLIGRVSASGETSTIYDGSTALTPKFVAISASSSGNNTILSAVASKKIRVLSLSLMSNGTVNAKFQSGAGGTDLTGLYYLVANTGFVLPYNPLGHFETASNTLLNLNLSGAIAVGGQLVYVEV